MLIVFIVLAIIMFFISVFLVEDNPKMSLPFITMGMIFTVVCTYGFYKVDQMYVAYNATIGNSSHYLASYDYHEPYSYIFFFFFAVFSVLLFRAGWNLWHEALENEKEVGKRGNTGRGF